MPRTSKASSLPLCYNPSPKCCIFEDLISIIVWLKRKHHGMSKAPYPSKKKKDCVLETSVYKRKHKEQLFGESSLMFTAQIPRADILQF